MTQIRSWRVLPECHERIAPNGTSGKAETAAPGRHEALLQGNCVVSQPGHPLSVRSWDSRFPGSATPSVDHLAGWIVELVKRAADCAGACDARLPAYPGACLVDEDSSSGSTLNPALTRLRQPEARNELQQTNLGAEGGRHDTIPWNEIASALVGIL